MAESLCVAVQWNKYTRGQTSMMVFLPFLETWKWGWWWSSHAGKRLGLSSQLTSVFHGLWTDILNPQARKLKLWDSFRTLGSNVCLLLWFMAVCSADVLWVGLSYSGGWRHTSIICTFLLRASRGSKMRSELRSAKRMVIFCVPHDIRAHPQFGTQFFFFNFAVQISIKWLWYHLKKSFTALPGFIDNNPTTDADHIWQESFCYHFVSCPCIPRDLCAQQHHTLLCAGVRFFFGQPQKVSTRTEEERTGLCRTRLCCDNRVCQWPLPSAQLSRLHTCQEDTAVPWALREPTDRLWQEKVCSVHAEEVVWWWLFFRTSVLPGTVHCATQHRHWEDPYW